MGLNNLYISACLIAVIGAIEIPQYAYQEVEDKAALLHKKPIIPIVKQSFEQSKEGYQYSYETGNGIHAQESGYIKNKGQKDHEILVQQGTITYHDEHGHPITLTYVADEKGFRPQGAHLPTPPPVPEEIVKSLEAHGGHYAQPEQNTEYKYAEQEAVGEYDTSQQEQLLQKEYQEQIQNQVQNQLQQKYEPQQHYQEQYQQQEEHHQPQKHYQQQYQQQEEQHQPQQHYQQQYQHKQKQRQQYHQLQHHHPHKQYKQHEYQYQEY